MKHLHQRLTAVLATFIATSAPGSGASVPPGPVYELDPFQVIGSREQAFELPGSGIYLGPEAIDRFKLTNINEILRQAPGVYVRDEDGFGLFPNISIRGVDTNRSAKVTLMEDGVLAAPAPYSAPAAYYSPTAGRMHAVEVLKGSSQIEYGPHTTGGVINYVSTPIPQTAAGLIDLSYGNYGTGSAHLWYGGKTQTDYGVLGALVELYHERSDGFRDIQPSVNGAFAGSDDTGYEKTDYMVKLSFEPDWERRNVFELKVGYTDLDADETYLGLNPSDLSEDPWDRYAASADDNIKTNHFRTYLRHLVEFDSDSRLTTTVYYNSFERDWYKLDRVNGQSPAEVILTDPGVLRGETPGDFKIKSNDREYYLYGVQTRYERAFETGRLSHELAVGVRLHKDKIDRYQNANVFNGVFAGDFGTPSERRGPDQEGDREQETVALALYVRDRIQAGDLAITPGLRWEYIDWDYIRRDGRTPPETDDGNYSVLAPGIGFEYTLDERSRLFGGYHRGFSVPSPGSKKNDFDEEVSDTFELGYRREGDNTVYFEAVAFYTLLKDLIVVDSISGGPGAEDGNIGDVETLGAELLAGADLGALLDRDFGIPVRLAFTWTDATLDGDIASADAESIFAAGEDGNQVPYVPEVQLNFTTGLEFERFRTYLAVTYVDERYADARNSDRQENTDGDPDSRFGKLDSYVTVDLSAFYKLNENVELFARATNLFEEEYVTSRLPLGPRAAAPRLVSAGLTYRF